MASIREELKRRLKSDLRYQDKRIVGSMISDPHAFAREIFAAHLDRNVGDEGLCLGTVSVEKETVAMLGDLLHHPGASGAIVTGGTEANILALWSARTRAGRTGGEVIVPFQAHISYVKAASMLGLELVHAPASPDHRMDPQAVRRLVGPNTIAIVAMAGSTELGLVDPIPALSDIALERDLFLHVDAAFGGFVLPFLESSAAFDFAVPGVSSVAINPHKMGLCVLPAGAILFRDEKLARNVSFEIPYLSGGKVTQGTIVGTRSGASVLAVWGMLQHLGREGYAEVVRECMELTHALCDRIARSPGLSIVTAPETNIVGVRPVGLGVPELARRMRRRGWAISEFPGHLRIVVQPHLDREAVLALAQDLEECVGGES
jgi:tyrosine decarboxylase/aspartate 1-decarboxylase